MLLACIRRTEQLIEGWARQYLKQPLKDKFCDYFDTEDFPKLSWRDTELC